MCTENLALKKPTWQSSTAAPFTGAERAVDGRHNDPSLWSKQCAVSEVGHTTAEWWVDLGGVKSIHHVFIEHVMGKSVLGIISFFLIDCHPN